jgi:NADPH:quinone reductase-like Zn-dependent oxidoreductase
VEAGDLLTRIDRVLPLAEAAEAHRLVEAGGLQGKVVLTP